MPAVHLRPYQLAQAQAVRDAWLTHRSTLVVAATGTGKTTLFCEVVRSAGARALVLVHREELLAQAARRIAEQTGLSVGIERGRDKVSRVMPPAVTVATVQSLRGKRLAEMPADLFGVIVVDEAHRSCAKGYRAILSHFADAKVLGVTATPDRSDKLALGEVFDAVCHEYDIRTATSDGWLVPIVGQRVHCAELDVSRVKTRGGDLADGELEQAVLVDGAMHQMASGIARYSTGRQTIVFMPGVESCHAMQRVLSGYTSDPIGVVVGNTPERERAYLLSEYSEGRLRYLVNCMVLTEGFDAPATGCIAVCRPTASRSTYAQQVGRGLRPAPGKTDCLVLDFVGNSGRHTLCCPADVLAGEPIPAEVAQYLTHAGDVQYDIDQAMGKAAKAASDALAAEQARKAQRRSRLTFDVTHSVKTFDPFDVLDVVDAGRQYGEPSLTYRQSDMLAKHGVPHDHRTGINQARKLIDAVIERQRAGLCSYKQAALLCKYGYSPDVSRQEASRIIDALAQNGWRKTG